MIKGRMLKIVQYLNKEKISSYKEIAHALDVKERSVRYDLERINDELSLRNAPLIEKRPKGVIFVPDELDLSIIVEDEDFVFSSKERINLIRSLILFNTEKLNIRYLSDYLQVSRRSIQNDINAVQQELEPYGLTLEYNRKFMLIGESELAYRLRSREFKRYIKSIYRKKIRNTYEDYMDKMFQKFFEPIDMESVLDWVSYVIDEMNWEFSDESYQWYVANVLTFTWYLKNDIELTIEVNEKKGMIEQSIEIYEKIIKKKLTTKEKGILSGFVRYTSRYDILDTNLDLISTEELAHELIQKMGDVLQIDFKEDGILRKGLLNHIGPMIERVRGDIQLDEEAESLIPEEYFDIYQKLKSLIRMDKRLYILTDNEVVYLAMYFLGSIRRMQKSPYMNILLVCGFGYGTTAVVKDTLRSKFQVHIRESVSSYQIDNYKNWDKVDAVISTVKIDLPVDKKLAVVNVIFNEEDYQKLRNLGLKRRNVLTNFFGIEKRLDFLNDSDRKKVMNVICEELGYQEVKVPCKYENIRDLIRPQSIRVIDHIDEWRDAVAKCTEILELQGSLLGDDYYNSIIHSMEVQGFYSVTDGEFALLHGSENAGVYESCMSLIITRQPVSFGEKKVNIIFCLASRDKKEHIPAVVRLMRLMKMTNFIECLRDCISVEEAIKIIDRCEKEVENTIHH